MTFDFSASAAASERRLYPSATELTLTALSGKWKSVILELLVERSRRYGDLRRALPGIADKMLTQRLRDLEHAGFVERTEEENAAVRYRATELGKTLLPVLIVLREWGGLMGAQAGARFVLPPEARQHAAG